MTPNKARDLLDGTTPGPWEWREGKDQNGEFVALCGPDGADALRTWDGDLYASGVHGTDADKALAAAAPTLAAMIAGMREEWGVEATHYRDSDPHTRWGYTDRQDAEAFARYMGKDPRWNAVRVVRRYVTTPEVIE